MLGTLRNSISSSDFHSNNTSENDRKRIICRTISEGKTSMNEINVMSVSRPSMRPNLLCRADHHNTTQDSLTSSNMAQCNMLHTLVLRYELRFSWSSPLIAPRADILRIELRSFLWNFYVVWNFVNLFSHPQFLKFLSVMLGFNYSDLHFWNEIKNVIDSAC